MSAVSAPRAESGNRVRARLQESQNNADNYSQEGNSRLRYSFSRKNQIPSWNIVRNCVHKTEWQLYSGNRFFVDVSWGAFAKPV